MSPLRRAILAYAQCRGFADEGRFHVLSLILNGELLWIASCRVVGRKWPIIYTQKIDWDISHEMQMEVFAGWLEFVEDMLGMQAVNGLFSRRGRRDLVEKGDEP